MSQTAVALLMFLHVSKRILLCRIRVQSKSHPRAAQHMLLLLTTAQDLLLINIKPNIKPNQAIASTPSDQCHQINAIISLIACYDCSYYICFVTRVADPGM
jgi:hypothetical protein